MFGKYNGFVSKARVSACMYFLVYQLSVPVYSVDLELGGLQRIPSLHCISYPCEANMLLEANMLHHKANMLLCDHANVSFDIPGHNKHLCIVYNKG
jgi:hypothetical protein